jgi:hypothetical protein
MDINNPFETFETSAFRLEALPQYLVEKEKASYLAFKTSGDKPTYFNREWSELVARHVKAGRSMRRLRLLSDELTDYERFETQVYSGLSAGEEIRANLRSQYAEAYRYDFWLFDNRWIAEVKYEEDGTFVAFETREASKKELAYAEYWIEVFDQSEFLDAYLGREPHC